MSTERMLLMANRYIDGPPSERMSLRIPADLNKRLKAVAVRRKKCRTDVILEALERDIGKPVKASDDGLFD